MMKNAAKILTKMCSQEIIFKYVCMFLCQVERGLINS